MINIKSLRVSIITIVILIISITTFLILSKDINNQNINENEQTNLNNTNTNDNINNDKDEVKVEIKSMKAIINNKEYEITLENNETVNSLINLLPLELEMNELNGNEKYYYLDEKLPTNSSIPKQIEKGDVMLYGNNCLVIFYKTFKTSYSYTKIGHINKLPDLGNGNIQITFSK